MNKFASHMKKYIKFIIVGTILLLACVVTLAANEAGLINLQSESKKNPLDSFEFKEITYTDNKGLTSGFTYNDGMFLTDNSVLSEDLAKMSVCLADGAYDSSDTAADCYDYKIPAYNMLNESDAMGFDSVKTFNYMRNATYLDNDFVAYTIASKAISYEGNTYNVYVIAIRGTSGNSEWYSNFNLGLRSDGYHKGFKIAADEVLNSIKETVNTSNNIFLVTGHSRGAAVANIVAGELSLRTEYAGIAGVHRVMAYTYACPAVNDQLSSYAKSLTNIYNLNNPGDAIPELPLECWGFSRYGQTVTLDYESSIYSNFVQ